MIDLSKTQEYKSCIELANLEEIVGSLNLLPNLGFFVFEVENDGSSNRSQLVPGRNQWLFSLTWMVVFADVYPDPPVKLPFLSHPSLISTVDEEVPGPPPARSSTVVCGSACPRHTGRRAHGEVDLWPPSCA